MRAAVDGVRHGGLARRVAALLCCVAFAPVLARAQNCAGLDEAVSALGAAHAQLTAIHDDELDPFLKPPAQHGIDAARTALAQLVAARMACAGDERAPALAADFTRLMQPLAAACDAQCAKSEYHDIPQFEVTTPAGHPRLRAIVAKLTIECGADSSLFLYERSGGRWRERVRWQSAPYDKVSGVLEGFDFRVAPDDANGGWYVLVKDFMPWCTSTWTTIRYAALRPATDGAAQRVAFRAQHSMWWGGDDIGRIGADAGEFEVRFHAASIDSGIHNREFIRRYAIDGDNVRRTAPVAATARDFADEWIVSPWEQAREWAGSPTLRDWHERLHGKTSPSYEFRAVRRCLDRPHHVEVDMVDQRDESEYFLSIDGRAAFTMTGVATEHAASCHGEDLLESMRTE